MNKNNRKSEVPNNQRQAKHFSVWDFISIVSHQLRNPLASTKLSIEMLLEEELGPLTEEQRDYLKMVLEDNQRMIRLVKEFLTISSIERGEIKLKPEPADLRDIISTTIKELTPFANAHNVTLEFSPPETFPEIKIDKLKVGEVIINFIDNAIKYNKGGGKITVRLEELPEENKIKFFCEDSGIGIPEKEKGLIFTKFFRATNAGQVHPEGTGVGLYIAKAVIENSGGKIGFESKEGEGSAFWFTLPIKT